MVAVRSSDEVGVEASFNVGGDLAGDDIVPLVDFIGVVVLNLEAIASVGFDYLAVPLNSHELAVDVLDFVGRDSKHPSPEAQCSWKC